MPARLSKGILNEGELSNSLSNSLSNRLSNSLNQYTLRIKILRRPVNDDD